MCSNAGICFLLQGKRVEAEKPAPSRWALRGAGKASSATGYHKQSKSGVDGLSMGKENLIATEANIYREALI